MCAFRWYEVPKGAADSYGLYEGTTGGTIIFA
jgi:hypothetical protein